MARKAPQLAKLTRPRLHKAVARERLFALLDEARDHKPAVCVVGPPGAGKTTLVASWLDARGIKGIWYQVDPGDADLATFFYYLGEAAKPFTRKGQRPLSLLTPEYLADVPGFSRRYFRELFGRLSTGATLVLDNFQEVPAEQRFHELIAAALAEVPVGITVICASRRDPPDCYARLIANENVFLLDWEDLKLTFEETCAIGQLRQPLSREKLDLLHQRSDGWAAGLVLMLERLKHGKGPIEASAPESLRDVFDYFAAQLVEQFDAGMQKALMQISYLPRMSASMAIAITGAPNAAALLEELHRRHLFTDRRAAQEPVYQFHALFQAYLEHRAQQTLTGQEQLQAALHAARLLEESGHPEEAFPLALKAGDEDRARAIVLRHAARLIGQGRWQVVIDWIEALPRDVVVADCWLLFWLGAARISVVPPQAREDLERSYELALGMSDLLCETQAAAAIVQTYMVEYARFRPLDRWIDAIQQALQCGVQFPNTDAEVRVQSALLAALAYRRPDDSETDSCGGRVLELLPLVRDVNLRVIAATCLLLWGSKTGPIEIAARSMPLLRTALQRSGVSPLNVAWAWFTISWYYCLVGDRRRSDEAIAAVEGIAEREGLPAVRKFTAAIASWVEMHACNIDAAQAWHDRFAQAIDPSSLWDRASVEAGDAWLAVLRNEPKAALRHGTSAVQFFDASGAIMLQVNHRLACIWANVLLGDFAEARRWIAEARGFASRIRSHWQEIALRATEAYIALECADAAAARERLRAAFALSRESGYHHSLGQHMRPWMSRLCAAALEAGIEVEYVCSQIRRFGWSVPPSRPERWPWAVSLHTLGAVQILVDGKPLVYGEKAPKRPLAVLKALVAMGSIRVSQQRLADALWPDREGDHALAALEIAVRRLRELLRVSDAVLVSQGCVSLNRELVWCDIEAFEDLVSDYAATERVERGLALYKGEFLAEEEAPWAMATHERVRRKFVHGIEALGRQMEAQQKYSETIGLYLRGLDADPLAEALYQGLMRCHLCAERKAEGLNVFRRLRQTLSLTLGVAPSPETERIHRALLDS
jgi:ATP/maltotriose-dependent transcriptional regulator MalT/DNA-binding SARP family transcriptional activator